MTWFHSIVRRRLRYGEHSNLADWNREYREGRWNWLSRLDELAHLAILGGYFRRLTPAGSSILDVGCGEGLLLPHVLDHSGRYLGIDGAAAIERAIARQRPQRGQIEFRVSDMNSMEPTEQFDAIVFCESIYYLHFLGKGLRHYLAALAPRGILLVSIHARRSHGHIWRELDRQCETLDAVHVENSAKVAWNVRAMRPRTTS